MSLAMHVFAYLEPRGTPRNSMDALSGYHPALFRLPSGTVDILHVRPQSGRLAQQWKSAMKPYAGFSKWGIPKTMGFNFNTKKV
jgi:hypothetical protein